MLILTGPFAIAHETDIDLALGLESLFYLELRDATGSLDSNVPPFLLAIAAGKSRQIFEYEWLDVLQVEISNQYEREITGVTEAIAIDLQSLIQVYLAQVLPGGRKTAWMFEGQDLFQLVSEDCFGSFQSVQDPLLDIGFPGGEGIRVFTRRGEAEIK